MHCARPSASPPLCGLAAAFALLLLAAPAHGTDTSPAGLWKTVSDVDGRAKAYVRIREEKGEFLGVIEEIFDPEKREKHCEKCPGERHDKPVLGMTIITGIHRDGERYTGGEILDPDDGRVYSCKLTPIDEGRRLEVRGYIGFSLLGRTQTWIRQE